MSPLQIAFVLGAALLLAAGASPTNAADSSGKPGNTTAPAHTPASGAVYLAPSSDQGKDIWMVSPGANLVTVNGGEIYMRQSLPQNTTNYAFARRPLSVPEKGAWQVALDVRFGDLGTCPTAVALRKGEDVIGWIGADNYFRMMGSFFGKDFFTDVDRGAFPVPDHEWHHFEFISDGATIAIRRDGNEVAHWVSRMRPDSLVVGQVHLVFGMQPANLQQTETWVHGVRTN